MDWKTAAWRVRVDRTLEQPNPRRMTVELAEAEAKLAVEAERIRVMQRCREKLGRERDELEARLKDAEDYWQHDQDKWRKEKIDLQARLAAAESEAEDLRCLVIDDVAEMGSRDTRIAALEASLAASEKIKAQDRHIISDQQADIALLREHICIHGDMTICGCFEARKPDPVSNYDVLKRGSKKSSPPPNPPSKKEE